MRVWEATIKVLKRTDNSFVMSGDEILLHEIASELGWDHHGYKTSQRVLAALRRTPGELKVSQSLSLGHWCNVFEIK